MSSVGTRGWAARPWQSKASVSIQSDSLTIVRMLELAVAASHAVKDGKGWVSVRERSASRVDLRVRDLVRSDGEEVMRFHVEVERVPGRVVVRSTIDTFAVKEGGFGALTSVANRKIAGYAAYESYLECLSAAVVAEDRHASVSFTSGK